MKRFLTLTTLCLLILPTLAKADLKCEDAQGNEIVRLESRLYGAEYIDALVQDGKVLCSPVLKGETRFGRTKYSCENRAFPSLTLIFEGPDAQFESDANSQPIRIYCGDL